MNKETQNEDNEPEFKDNQNEKDRNMSAFSPLKVREPNDSRMNSNFKNLQNSASKYFKNETKPESANNFL
jgi:hypothetical protein